MARLAVPAVALAALLQPGCAEMRAVVAPSPAIELPSPEDEFVIANLAAKGLTLATADSAQLLQAVSEELAPLPVADAWVEDGVLTVVIAPLGEPVLKMIALRLTASAGAGPGAIPGAIGGGLAGGAGLVYLILKWRDLMRRAAERKSKPAPAPTPTPQPVVTP